MKTPASEIRCFLLGSVAAAVCVSAVRASEDDDALWREKIGYNPQVHGTVPQSSDDDVIARVPYAYYPYSNELEVIFDLAAARNLLPPDTQLTEPNPTSVRVNVFLSAGREPIATGSIPLDAQGRGHGINKLPDLPAGVYRVEYEFGGVTLPASRTFRRTHFEFEHNTDGLKHQVYAPFEPVRVKGRTVSIVDRTYTINAEGLFDSVISQGRELLAEPMQLVVETADGKRVEWGTGWFRSGVKGHALYPDLAVFRTEARGSGFSVQCSVEVEEDGCAKVTMVLEPETRNLKPVKRAWLRMALPDSEAPLCHLVGLNSMRHNYAGSVPRGGKVTWVNQGWRPARFMVEPFAGEPPRSYQVWEARNLMHWGGQKWCFAPYLWLGAEERGLAWFGDDLQGYVPDGTNSIQRLSIEPGKVVLRVELIQQPTVLDAPRTFEFGLQASPTKPMPEGWRGYDVPGGGGMPVVVWGGYNCASKYPDPKDWSLVEKIVAGRGSKRVDRAFFEALDQRRLFPNAKTLDGSWLDMVLHFAGKEAGNPHPNGTTVYFEEHQTHGDHPEMVEYMDEWADTTWSRFRYFAYSGYQEGTLEKGTWGPEVRSANARSYRDFAVWYADQWLRRGVGIYYDNTFPKLDYNRQHFLDRGIAWSSSLWAHREYYKRVWKRSRELMAKGRTPLDPLSQETEPGRRMRLHTVGHVTNCQVLPYTTWWDATLGVEAPGQWQPDQMPSAEAIKKSLKEWSFVILPGPSTNTTGRALPYPPDYLRAMECGRMAGLIPYYRHLLRSEDAFGGLGIGYGATSQGQDPAVRAHRYLSDAGMGLVHEIRGGSNEGPAGDLKRFLREFGYGKPDVVVHNYWDENPFVRVNDERVKWIAVERFQVSGFSVQEGHPAASRLKADTRHPKPVVLLLLQSYRPEACAVTVDVPGAGALLDVFTRELLPAGAPIALPADYGTRLLLAAADAEELKPLAWGPDVITAADFDLGLPAGWTRRGDSGVTPIMADPERPGNHVLRIQPAHPSQYYVQGPAEGDFELSFRFRLPPVTGPLPHTRMYGLLQLLHRWSQEWPKQTGYTLALGIKPGGDGAPVLAADYSASREGQATAFAEVTANRLADLGPLVPLDTAWHTVSIRLAGNRHTIRLDEQLVFDGACDASAGGAVRIGPGWGAGESGVPFVEVDDIRIRR